MRLGPVLVCAVVASMMPYRASAYVCKVSEKYPFVTLHWNARVISYGVREPRPMPSGVDRASALKAAEAAFRAWAAESCTDLRFEPKGIVDVAASDVNQVVFVNENWRGEPAAVAITRTTYTTKNGIITAATIEVNQASFRFGDAMRGCDINGDIYDLEAVLTHEVGHFIGLDHTVNFSRRPTDPTMAPEVGPCEVDKRTLESDDIEGMCRIYPAGDVTRSCEPLPVQEIPYVNSAPFGCSSTSTKTRPAGESVFVLILVSALGWIGRNAKRLGR